MAHPVPGPFSCGAGETASPAPPSMVGGEGTFSPSVAGYVFFVECWDDTLGYPGEGPRNLQKTRVGGKYSKLFEQAWQRMRDYNESMGGASLLDITRRSRSANQFLVG